MSIIAAADVMSMTTQGEASLPRDPDGDVAMRLMEAGVPLRLLVDIALPMGLLRELCADPDRAAQG